MNSLPKPAAAMMSRHTLSTSPALTPARTAAKPASCDSRTTSCIVRKSGLTSPIRYVRVMSE
ncbi:MAG: hypothetical protein ABR58_05320 [Acidimicrobium sp. BACL19 MAG-120924-bin39]|nr:MAG: hypothetical protein ABR58_05320 [Acidimicrobium sp. BACL19 MAG-120924-bin39]